MRRMVLGLNNGMTEVAESTLGGAAAPVTSRKKIWVARIMTGMAVALFAMDAAMKLLRVPAAVQGTLQLGYPATAVFAIGVVQVACLALYAVPRTAVLGAVLPTGYLGGAVATPCASVIPCSLTCCRRSILLQ